MSLYLKGNTPWPSLVGLHCFPECLASGPMQGRLISFDNETGTGLKRRIGSIDEWHGAIIGPPLIGGDFTANIASLGIVKLDEWILAQQTLQLLGLIESVAT